MGNNYNVGDKMTRYVLIDKFNFELWTIVIFTLGYGIGSIITMVIK